MAKYQHPKKAKNRKVDQDFLNDRKQRLIKAGYPTSKWIALCESLMGLGLEVSLYEAKRTVSKYLIVEGNGKTFKIRFSNHRPTLAKQSQGDSDFYVGVSNGQVTTTEDALEAVKKYFGILEAA